MGSKSSSSGQPRGAGVTTFCLASCRSFLFQFCVCKMHDSPLRCQETQRLCVPVIKGYNLNFKKLLQAYLPDYHQTKAHVKAKVSLVLFQSLEQETQCQNFQGACCLKWACPPPSWIQIPTCPAIGMLTPLQVHRAGIEPASLPFQPSNNMR